MKKLLTTLAAAMGIATSAFAATLDLSTVTDDLDFDGVVVQVNAKSKLLMIHKDMTLTGTLSSDYDLWILGATITLQNVTITNTSPKSTTYGSIAVISCAQQDGRNPVLVLEGVNTVSTEEGSPYPGIGIADKNFEGGMTLTITGSGTLNVSGFEGIGAYASYGTGNIVIESGTINATGSGGAGIGSNSGNITINGGTINAIGGPHCAGIGSGQVGASCGNITINGGNVTATGWGKGAGIGSGRNKGCGDITINGGNVTATCGADCDNPIGAGNGGTCGTVTVSGDMLDTTSGSTRTLRSSVCDLATLTGNTTVEDGTLVKGTLGGNYKVTIADGATVVLRDVAINGVNSSSCNWAGITCEGDATIILRGDNSVSGFYQYNPGIYVPSGKTLTIEGDGALTASGSYRASGIGGGQTLNCGNIVIEGGNITAAGGDSNAAGIGSGYNRSCGTITISGGTVNATGGDSAAGIGSGYFGSCGAISITGGTVAATGGDSAAGIGSGFQGSCAGVDVGAGIVRVTATCGTGCSNPVGRGYYGSCGDVTVADALSDATVGSTRTIEPKVVDLSTLTGDKTVADGYTIIGTLGGNYKISIADGATVTISNAVINGVNSSGCKWAGITCEGDAAILLEGANTVKGFYEDYPGIYVPTNKTLTIGGGGSLTASSNDYGAGIGGGYDIACGNIVIEGGTITATGGRYSAAGIGGAYDATCGNIVIEGGSITATGGETAAGIGGGYRGDCGDITIGGGSVIATGDAGAAGIGGGQGGSCGTITIIGGTVTSAGGEYASGIGSGRNGSCGAITVGASITSVVATHGANGVNAIGAGNGGSCTGVSVASSLLDATVGSTRTIDQKVINLSTLTGDTTIADGHIITGTLGGRYKVSIADGATVTISNAVINGVNSSGCKWAGITCEGDATILLEGANTVKGFYELHPGIYVPEGKTMTIGGSGSLTASSNGFGAGIGGGNEIDCGNIVIAGGSITATGGQLAAGIGGAYNANCGNIIIEGGSITATGDLTSAGIGSGWKGSCGTISIGDAITCVTATCGNLCENPIGAGWEGSCAGVSVADGLSDTTTGLTRVIERRAASGFASWVESKGLAGADAAWDAKPVKWNGWPNAFIYTYGEGLADGSVAIMSISFGTDGKPIITTTPVIEGHTDFTPAVIGTSVLDSWISPVILIQSGNSWSLPSGQSANFFRVRLTE